MKNLLLFILVIFQSIGVSAKIVELNDESVKTWIDSIPPAEEIAEVSANLRPDLIALIRPYLNHDLRCYRAQRVLLELGDRELAQQLVRDVRQGPTDGATFNRNYDQSCLTLSDCSQPWLIPLVADMLFIEEDARIYIDPGSDVGTSPRSTAAAYIVYKVLSRSPAFSPAVREWAGRLSEGYGRGTEYRQSARTWWQQNKAHFEKQDYAAVTPLQPVTNAVPPSRSNLVPETNAAPAVIKGELTPKPANSSTVQAEEPSASKFSWRLPGMIAGILVLAIGFALLKRRPPS